MKDIFNTLYNFGMFGRDASFRDQVKVCKDLGFQGLEMFAPFDDETVSIINEFGMKILEGRKNLNDSGELMYIENMQKLGVKYIGGPEGYNDRESALKTAEELNELGRMVKPYGFKATTHNHTGEFRFNETDGEYCWETVAKNTDPDLVCFKLDIGWATIAGADVIYLLNKYPGRTELVHVKPATKILGAEAMDTRKTNEQRGAMPPPDKMPSADEMKKMMEKLFAPLIPAQTEMKNYVRDLAEMLTLAEQKGAVGFILERDYFYKEDRVEVMAEDLAYIRSVWN